MFSKTEAELLAAKLARIVFHAGEQILTVYAGDFSSELKQDNTPITRADRLSHQTILQGLELLEVPDRGILPVLSEEGKDIPYQDRRSWESYWLVDPLDGTKEFISRNGEFTVNIALISAGRPVCGAVYIPVSHRLYTGFLGYGAFRTDSLESNLEQPLTRGLRLPLEPAAETVNPADPGDHTVHPLTIIASRSHGGPETDRFIRHIRASGIPVETETSGSSLKFCRIAEGSADIYPRFGPTMEWDTAAAHAVCSAAGCSVVTVPSGNELVYNKDTLKNPWFAVYRDPAIEQFFNYFHAIRNSE